MSGRLSRNKGKRAEREIVTLLQGVVNQVYREHGKIPVVLQRNLMQSHKGGADITSLPWMAVEVKHHARQQPDAWWRQTLEQAEGRWPVLAYRGNRTVWTFRIPSNCSSTGMTLRGEEWAEMPWDLFRIIFGYFVKLYLQREEFESIVRT